MNIFNRVILVQEPDPEAASMQYTSKKKISKEQKKFAIWVEIIYGSR